MTGASNPGNQFDSKAYLVLGSKPWNRRLFDELLSKLDGRWSYMGEPAQLSASSVSRIAPRYIFSLHWSWRVPKDIPALSWIMKASGSNSAAPHYTTVGLWLTSPSHSSQKTTGYKNENSCGCCPSRR